MKLSICTDVMGNLSFTEMLDKCVALGVEGIEMTGVPVVAVQWHPEMMRLDDPSFRWLVDHARHRSRQS